MDGENHGKPNEQMDDLGVPLFSETSICPKKGDFHYIIIYYTYSGDGIETINPTLGKGLDSYYW